MTIVFEDNLVLDEDKSFDESIKVEGNIRCEDGRYSLKVAGSIDARDIDAWNIDALDIDARDIDAENIIYYGFCIAYSTLKCTSIEGRRDNSLHECLDGSI